MCLWNRIRIKHTIRVNMVNVQRNACKRFSVKFNMHASFSGKIDSDQGQNNAMVTYVKQINPGCLFTFVTNNG